jgi:alpha-1,3/alpha-1,6-mannosyltransferase
MLLSKSSLEGKNDQQSLFDELHGRMTEVAIIHPDLGIGGAERLILDVAHAVTSAGRHPVIWTSCYERSRAFDDASGFQIEVRGGFLPRHILGCFHIIFALLRNLFVTISCARSSPAKIFIVDQISAWLPVLRWLRPDAVIIFYCHFPDLLLASHRSILRRIYRYPFDSLERSGIRKANIVLVNSEFTRATAEAVLGIHNVSVLYPCVRLPEAIESSGRNPNRRRPTTPSFVSLNRYERKKNHGLAIDALSIFVSTFPGATLTIAGGYDPKVRENVEHERELIAAAAAKFGASQSRVIFLRNIKEDEKKRLIEEATAVVYTPQDEHFGIVPIEAMSLGTPVIGCNSGGPKETIDCPGCRLCEPTPEAFADAMRRVAEDDDREGQLIAHAAKFGFSQFAERWKQVLDAF